MQQIMKIMGNISLKHYLFLALSCLVSAVAVASPITAEQASAIAQSFLGDMHNHSTRRLVNLHTATTKANALQLVSSPANTYYAFNLQRQEGGFVIVAADDAAQNSVLAFSENGVFDYATMPAHVRWWFEQYEHIDYTAQSISSENTDNKRNVEPLIETRWAQGEPYNLRTPTISGSHCATGCVATAWGQLLYFHKYPSQGKGSHGYHWNNQYLSTDFSKPYDWEHILTQYNASATAEERQAVALLMSDIGIASELQYGVESTGGHEYNSLHSMIEHFGYDSAAELRYRNLFDVVDWKDMLRRNLDKGLPMYYGGFNKEGGHAFICDGYEGDFFHFNFGWGGNYNGYYVFNKLHGDYNDRQCAVFNFQPDTGGHPEHTLTMSSGIQLTRSREVRCGAIYTGLYDSISFQVGLFFEDIAAQQTTPLLLRTYDNSTTSIGLQQFGIMPYVLNKNNVNGTYKTYYMYRNDSTDTWRNFYYPHGVKRYIVIKVEDGKGTVVGEDTVDTSLSFEQDGIHYNILSEYFSEVEVAKHNYSKTVYTIPGAIVRNGKEYKVASIADSAFLGCNRLQLLELQEGIEHIGIASFAGCTRLEQITLPSTLSSIENNAFAGDTKLTNIRSYTSTPPELKGSTVFQRNRLKLITLWVSCEAGEKYKAINIWNDMQMLTTNFYLQLSTEGDGEVTITNAGCDSLLLVATAADHFYFAGWTNNNNADTLIVTLKSDTSVSALFNPQIYAVRFYAETELLKTDSVEAYKPAVAPEAPARSGYLFAGWDKDFSSVVADMDVNAIYEATSGIEDIADMTNSGKTILFTIDGRIVSSKLMLEENLTKGVYIMQRDTEVRKIIIR